MQTNGNVKVEWKEGAKTCLCPEFQDVGEGAGKENVEVIQEDISDHATPEEEEGEEEEEEAAQPSDQLSDGCVDVLSTRTGRAYRVERFSLKTSLFQNPITGRRNTVFLLNVIGLVTVNL